jgi:hypothetical protein
MRRAPSICKKGCLWSDTTSEGLQECAFCFAVKLADRGLAIRYLLAHLQAEPGQKARLEALDNPELLRRVQAELVRWKASKPKPISASAKSAKSAKYRDAHKPAPRKPKR